MVKYSVAVLAAALAAAQAVPMEQCKLATYVLTGSPVWVPTPEATSWAVWSTTSKTPVASSKADPTTWSAWTSSSSKKPDGSTKTSSTTWSDWDPSKTPVASSTTSKTPVASSTSKYTWSDWSSSTSAKPTTTSSEGHEHSYTDTATWTPTTTAAPTTATTPTTTEAPTTSTTSTPPPQATCPASGSMTSFGTSSSGSCGCDYEVYCNGQSYPTHGVTKFWERTTGEYIGSLEECIAICDSNSDCDAVIWNDSPQAGDADRYHCWQTSGLSTPGGDGIGRLAFKSSGSCKNTCNGYDQGVSPIPK